MKNLLNYLITILILISGNTALNAQYSQSFEDDFYPSGWSGSGFAKSNDVSKTGLYSAAGELNAASQTASYLKFSRLDFGSVTSISFWYRAKAGNSATIAVFLINENTESADSTHIEDFNPSSDAWNSYEISIPTSFSNTNNNAIIILIKHSNPESPEDNVVYIDDISSDSPLPVVMESFSFTKSQNTVSLKWKTTYEINNSGFEVQRMEKGTWNKIGFVPSLNSGNYSFSDKDLKTGTYQYRLKQIDYNGNFEFFALNSVITIEAPASYKLSQNYPNPFNPVTTIEFSIPKAGNVTIKIYDITGKEFSTTVYNTPLENGVHKFKFNAAGFSSGIYFYTLYVDNQKIDTKKMVLTK